MGAGTYIYPTVRGNFLSLSGGTVTGDTFFSTNLSATTYFSGSTPLQSIIYSAISGVTSGLTSFLQPSYIGYGSTSSGLTGSAGLQFSAVSAYKFLLSPWVGVGSIPAIYMLPSGTTPSLTNFTISIDGVNTYYNTISTSGRAQFRAGGNDIMNITSTGLRVGSGNATARLHVFSSSTTVAGLRLDSGSTVASPNDGDIWNDGLNLIARIGGVTQQLNNYNITAQTVMVSGMTSTGSTRIVEANSGGTLSATKEIIDQWLYDFTTITNLETASNWSDYGVYTGTTITNTYRGQMHSDDNYLYIAVADNTWRRTNFV